jgi:hypothetical protein
MRGFLFAFGLLFGFIAAPLASAGSRVGETVTEMAGCCRICTTGKACGNSCISRPLACHEPPRCATSASDCVA